MSRRLFLPLLIGLWLLVAGLLLRHGGVLMLAIPPILFACVSVIASLRFELPDIRVTRTASRHRMTEGEEADIVVEVSIPFAHSFRGELSIIDDLPTGALQVDGENQYLGDLVPGESARFAYRVRFARGVHRFPGVTATAWSRWGWTGAQSTLPHETIITAHPRTERLKTISIHPRRTRAFAGPVRASRGGQGIDFFGSRTYVPGDDIRRINWRAYARQGNLIVNEYELERLADVNIIVDARLIAHYRLEHETTFDHTLRAAGSLAQHFLHAGNIVGLLVYGDLIQWVFPGVGKPQECRILDMLASSHAAEKEVFEDLANIPTRLFPAQSQLVLISPLVDDADVEVIAKLLDHGYSIILVTPHATTWEAKQIGSGASAQVAARMSNLRRSLFLDSLIRTGTSIVNWDVAEPLGYAVERDLGAARFRRHT
ncbi:DUF58 domain-containing protein [Candidatus Bipolaricaulota bacterium]|nr:DUF58 domain-containing protein [Candidatus Bipolaricaulota bacterium]